MKLHSLFAGAVAASAAFAGAAGASTVYDNPYSGVNADCSFGTVCAADAGRGDDFAAQQFTLASADVITGAAFLELDPGTVPTDINWAFILADGAGGLPGTILASGTDNFTSAKIVGSSFGLNETELTFDVGTVALGAGTYYLALKADTTIHGNYLGFGVQGFGAAETHDGGLTWASTYEGAPSIAVSIFDAGAAAPEPASWALMMIGFAGIGGALRRRSGTFAAA